MKNKKARVLVAVLTSVFMMLSPFFVRSAQAANPPYSDSVGISEDAYNTLAAGTTVYNGVNYANAPWFYNPLTYFLNYADLRAAYGANPNKLIEHYVRYGIAEGRNASTYVSRGAQAYSSSKEYVVPSNQLTSTQADGMTVIPEQLHGNGGMNRRQEDEARSVARQLATNIFNQVTANGTGTEIEMVAYATGIVNAYCNAGSFSTSGNVYRTAYGVFCEHQYSSAGATRALGLILDYLDEIIHTNNPAAPPLKWVHVNANTWDDQWCQIVCDNHEAYADPINSWAGYGKHPNWGGLPVDFRTYFNYAGEIDILNTRPPYVEGDYKITVNNAQNKNPMSGQKPKY